MKNSHLEDKSNILVVKINIQDFDYYYYIYIFNTYLFICLIIYFNYSF